MSLLDRHVGFVRALREAGLPVSPAEGLDAARALLVVDLAERESLRAAYAATLVKRPSYRPGFDALFDLWFPAATTAPHALPDPEGPRDPHGPRAGDPGADLFESADLAEGMDLGTAALPELRDRLAELLLDAEGMDAFARAMVERFGRQAASPGRQNWFSYPVLRALSPETLIARLLAEVLAGRERGGLAEKVARRRIGDNIRRFEEAVATDVRRRIAEESGIERIARSAVRPPLEQVDFLRVTRADLARLRREVHPLARRLAARLTVRNRTGHRGRLDFRRTVRASLSSGGVPLAVFNRPRRPHRPELVVLCDVSDSVASFAHFTLLLTYALREQFAKVRAFGFVDTVDEITRFFTPGADVAEAMTRMAAEADMVRFGRTNYGHAFERFAERYGDAVGPKTSLLILGDARSNHQPPALETLRGLAREARHAHWLNPEPVSQWDTGDSLASAYGAVVPMRECRNVVQLAAFVEDLA